MSPRLPHRTHAADRPPLAAATMQAAAAGLEPPLFRGGASVQFRLCCRIRPAPTANAGITREYYNLVLNRTSYTIIKCFIYLSASASKIPRPRRHRTTFAAIGASG